MYRYYCLKCDVIHDLLVTYESRDNPQDCEQCGNLCDRTWEGASTPVLRASHPDGYKRFDQQRTYNVLTKERSKAKARGDMESYEKVKTEIKKVGGKD